MWEKFSAFQHREEEEGFADFGHGRNFFIKMWNAQKVLGICENMRLLLL